MKAGLNRKSYLWITMIYAIINQINKIQKRKHNLIYDIITDFVLSRLYFIVEMLHF